MLTASYDYRLVVLSVAFALLAAYAAIDLAGRVTATRGWAKALWLAGGAAAMGLGIWTMHYIGMLALILPVPVLYHYPTVVLSLLVAIAASAVALFTVSRKRLGVMPGNRGRARDGRGNRGHALHRHGGHAPAGHHGIQLEFGGAFGGSRHWQFLWRH